MIEVMVTRDSSDCVVNGSDDDKDYPPVDYMPLPDSYLIKKRLSVHLERRRGSIPDAASKHHANFTHLLFPNGSVSDDRTSVPSDVYGFSVRDMNDHEVRLEQFRGYVLLIVNVASECGLTQVNYNHLNYLHDKYHEQGLRILAFPCNQFGQQEPGSVQQITDFLDRNDVKFEVFSKIDVNGDAAHPLFHFLQNKLSGSLTNHIKWNFTKFLINRNGVPVDRYAPTTAPKDIEDDITRFLNV